jgi:hypothetical protein
MLEGLLVSHRLGRSGLRGSFWEWLDEVELDVFVDGHEKHLSFEIENTHATGSLQGANLKA